MYCLTVTHHTAIGYEERVDRKVVAFMGERQKVFKEAFEEFGGKINNSIDFMGVDYEAYFNVLIKAKNGTLDYYEYHLERIRGEGIYARKD